MVLVSNLEYQKMVVRRLGFEEIRKKTRSSTRSRRMDPRLNIWMSIITTQLEGDEKTSWVLFGGNSFLSPHRNTNPFLFEDFCYVSICHGFLHQLAISHDLPMIAAEIMASPNAYTATKLNKIISCVEDRPREASIMMTDNEIRILQRLTRTYYEQNPFFKEQLLKTMTAKNLIYLRDADFKNWSCGLRKPSRIKNKSNWLGKNLFGEILTSVRETFFLEQ